MSSFVSSCQFRLTQSSWVAKDLGSDESGPPPLFLNLGNFQALNFYVLLNYKSDCALKGKRISIITAKVVLSILFLIQILFFTHQTVPLPFAD